MSSRIEDYALIGDCQSAALVSKSGSIDWLCLPRFDADACFAALVGAEDNGFWRIAPSVPVTRVRRAYRRDTLTLETEMTTDRGTVVVVDAMHAGADRRRPSVVRLVVGKEGEVPVTMELVMRLGYGKVVPWVDRCEGGITAIGGPERLRLTTPAKLVSESFRTRADLVVKAGQRVPFVLGWSPSHLPAPEPIDAEKAIAQSDAFFAKWVERCVDVGPYTEIVRRSLLTLKALTYAQTGGIVASPTTSLPEQLGGVRNWDYRFCWLRDSTFTLQALMHAGFDDEAAAWRRWLLRAAAGAPQQLQIMYGLAGERRLTETTLDWLPGYAGSKPVRIGNAASEQLQLDVYGELVDALFVAQTQGLANGAHAWAIERAIVGHVEEIWTRPDHGIWEVRGQERHFVHSKVMCWVAIDRAVKTFERAKEDPGREAPVRRLRALRERIHADICARGWDASLGSFVQHYGSKDADASLLMMPLVGFLPADDPRVVGTVRHIERSLVVDGLVARYPTRRHVDGLPEGEGTFLACSFWLADAMVLMGREDEARALFERLVGLANDVGLLSEEYDPSAKRMLGNFPQALSHVALVNTAVNLSKHHGPARQRQNA